MAAAEDPELLEPVPVGTVESTAAAAAGKGPAVRAEILPAVAAAVVQRPAPAATQEISEGAVAPETRTRPMVETVDTAPAAARPEAAAAAAALEV